MLVETYPLLQLSTSFRPKPVRLRDQTCFCGRSISLFEVLWFFASFVFFLVCFSAQAADLFAILALRVLVCRSTEAAHDIEPSFLSSGPDSRFSFIFGREPNGCGSKKWYQDDTWVNGSEDSED